MCDMVCQYIQKKEEEKQIKEERAAKTRYWKILACYDDDDDDFTIAITQKEPDNSRSMGDEHLDTISATELDEFIKSTLSQTQEDDYDSEMDILILKELVRNDSLLFPENESFHFDIPSSSRPPAKYQMEKSPDLLSHQGHEAFQLSAECSMMIYGKNNP
nr:hypothetical protein [Tanacetum cinerariifolium]